MSPGGGIPSNLYYRWSKDFLEAGKQRLVGDTERQADGRQVNEMRAELEQLKQLVAELSLKNRVLKKRLAGQGTTVGQMMRRSPAEKREIIDLVEHSALPIGRTLAELDVPRSSFYRWYQEYKQEGEQGLEPQPSKRRQFWNRLPQPVCDQIVRLALAQPAKSARQLAWLFTPFGPGAPARRGETADQEGYFVSESSVFRLLKRFDLVESPAFQLVTAADRFAHPTRRVNELWQIDFTYFKIRGWYYLSTVLDDYSRYILAWKLSATMAATDVQDTLELALARARLDRV